MDEMGFLKGSLVRDHMGRQGRLVSVSSSDVVVEWLNDLLSSSERVGKSSDRYKYGLEVLTMTEGWMRLGKALPHKHSGVVVTEEDHNPFKRRSVLGPGPRGETLRRKGDWDCRSIGPYRQICRGVSARTEGREVEIQIDPEYKRAYNREYKQFAKKRKGARDKALRLARRK